MSLHNNIIYHDSTTSVVLQKHLTSKVVLWEPYYGSRTMRVVLWKFLFLTICSPVFWCTCFTILAIASTNAKSSLRLPSFKLHLFLAAFRLFFRVRLEWSMNPIFSHHCNLYFTPRHTDIHTDITTFICLNLYKP